MPRLTFGVITLLLLISSPAWAQPDPSGKPLTRFEVSAEIEARILRDPSYATIWNTGYDFYRLHLRNQDTAKAIYLGYSAVMRRGLTPEVNLAIRQATIYWQKVYEYGIINVPVGVDNNWRGQIYYGGGYLTTLKMRRPKGGPVPLIPNPKGRSKREPYKGHRENPYPGPYYPGVYPP
ncbi:MAG: hypothetical protein LBS60_02480 [Deltaproteobacteria bacterium]|jgi:hypothetical protein|nr:hypothetical protein [Deltaproteobacteria bacterium]